MAEVKLKYLCKSFSTPLTQRELQDMGEYRVYGASGLVGYLDQYACDTPYLGIIKDGAGVGRINYYEEKTSLLGTMAYIIPNSTVDISWLKYAITAMDLGKDVGKTTIPHIYFSEYGNRYVPYIPQKQQKRIASFLDSKCDTLDNAICKAKATIDEYKKLKQSIITEAVTKGIRGDRPMKDSGLVWIERIPNDWVVVRGKQVFYETSEISETGNEELLTVSHITGVTPRSQKNVNMFMADNLIGYKICRVGDVAANTMWMWQGAIGVSKYHGVISPSYNTYRQIGTAFTPEYLDYLLRIRPLIDTYNAYSTGITASRLRLYPDQFLSLKFIVPGIKEQQEIANYLDKKCAEIDALISKKTALLEELETYKKSMIYEYVTGKQEVP